jgi:HlyD family secretion protein
LKTKKFIILPIIFILIVVVVYAFGHRKTDINYEIAKVEKGNITKTVLSTGTVNPVTLVKVGSQISGKIKDIYVDYNSPVKKNQVIARIDPSLYEAEEKKASADYESAKATMEKAEAELCYARKKLNRYTILLEDELVSKDDFDITEKEYKLCLAGFLSAKADVSRAEASLKRAKTNLNYTIIKSPVNGIVISRDVDIGQTVAASFQTPTLFTIAQDLKKMQVTADIDEADVGCIKVNQKATFSVDAYPSLVFQGIVTQVRNAPEIVQNVVTYDVVIDVNNPELLLKPGMTASVSIVVARKKDILKIPNASLRFIPPFEEGLKENTVWKVLPDGKLKPISVKLGIFNDNFTEVIQGDLKKGDKLATSISVKKESSKKHRFFPWR